MRILTALPGHKLALAALRHAPRRTLRYGGMVPEKIFDSRHEVLTL